MAEANRKSSTKLFDMISDSVIRAAIERAELDYGQTFAIPANPQRTLNGGAAEHVRELEGA